MAIPGYGETIVHLVDIYIELINASLIQLDRRHTYSKPFATSWCVDAHDALNLTSFFLAIVPGQWDLPPFAVFDDSENVWRSKRVASTWRPKT